MKTFNKHNLEESLLMYEEMNRRALIMHGTHTQIPMRYTPGFVAIDNRAKI